VWRHTVRSIRSGPGAASPARGEQKLQFKLGKAKVNSLTIEKEIGWLDWLSTMEGRQAMHRAWFWGLTSIGGASIAIHWVAPKWLTRYYCDRPDDVPQLFSVGKSIEEADPALTRLAVRSVSRAGLDPNLLDSCQLLHTDLMDPVVLGWLVRSGTAGAAVLLPRHATQDPPDLSSLKVKTGFHRWFGGFPLPDLQPEERAELSRVLQVSPGEREMLMSRSLALAGGWGCLASLVAAPTLWTIWFVTALRLNKGNKNFAGLLSHPRPIRAVAQCVVGVFYLMVYLIQHAWGSWEAETAALTQVCRDRAEADLAAGYYERQLERNRLLLRLVPALQYYIQADGELVPWWYEMGDYTSVQARIDFLNSLHREEGQLNIDTVQ